MRLEGKVAIITGAGSGIGRATALRFSHEGVAVVVADIDADAAGTVSEEIRADGGEATAVRVDVSQSEQVREMVDVAVRAYDRVDIMFSNAGIEFPARATEIEPDDWDRVMAVNLKSVYLCARCVIPRMVAQGGGVIVNTASQLGLVGYPNFAVYNAAKGGVINLTRNLALDYAKEGVRVNAVCPGPCDTPHVDRQLENLPPDEQQEVRNSINSLVPMGRMGRPEEIAGAVVFLASDDASYMTGSMLVVDGGYTAQ